MERIITCSAEETRALGQKIARSLSPGAILALSGDLGAGKTEFVKGVAAGMGARVPVKSPSFIIHRTYPDAKGSLIHHVDLYRLGSLRDAESAGILELLEKPGRAVLIEWPDLISSHLPKKTVYINISHGTTPNKRKLTIATR